jgi:hypothetical protein
MSHVRADSCTTGTVRRVEAGGIARLTWRVAPVAEPELPQALVELRDVALWVLAVKVQRLRVLLWDRQLLDELFVVPAEKETGCVNQGGLQA